MSELEYPFAGPPDHGSTKEVAPGVYWVRMPLPLALDHINLYLLDDGDGWWVIDTGIGGETTRAHWQSIFSQHLDGRPVKAVYVTHMHPDHVGQAAWICEHWRAPLYMTFAEYYSARTYSGMTADDLGWATRQFYVRAGMSDEVVDRMRAHFRGFASVIDGVPDAFRRIRDGDRLTIGGCDWEVWVGSGHSPEHASLYCAERGLLLAGDQIIPRITPNVSVVSLEPEANPLRDWLQSLARFRQLPFDTLVLPAHNTPFYGLHPRIEYLISHHEDHLQALLEACLQAATAYELIPVLFDRTLDNTQLTLALGECIAHLNFLLAEGKLERERYGDVYRYRTTDPSSVQLGVEHHLDPPPIQV